MGAHFIEFTNFHFIISQLSDQTAQTIGSMLFCVFGGSQPMLGCIEDEIHFILYCENNNATRKDYNSIIILQNFPETYTF